MLTVVQHGCQLQLSTSQVMSMIIDLTDRIYDYSNHLTVNVYQSHLEYSLGDSAVACLLPLSRHQNVVPASVISVAANEVESVCRADGLQLS